MNQYECLQVITVQLVEAFTDFVKHLPRILVSDLFAPYAPTRTDPKFKGPDMTVLINGFKGIQKAR